MKTNLLAENSEELVANDDMLGLFFNVANGGVRIFVKFLFISNGAQQK